MSPTTRLQNRPSEEADDLSTPWAGTQFTTGHLEARAAGHEAFWHGRPIWANPLVGHPAREWTLGWKQGASQFEAIQGEIGLSVSPAERRRLLKLHRPEDVAAPSQREESRSYSTAS